MEAGSDSVGEADDSGLRWRTYRFLSVTDTLLWTVVIITSVFDILTTMVGLNHRLEEGNVVAEAFIATYGMPGIGLLKFSALVLLAISWAILFDRHATKLLAAFGVISLATVTWNVMTLAAI